MAEPQKIRLTLSPQAEKYVRRDAPVEARRMAAGGALPLPPIELATVLFALVHDPDDQVKQKARASLESLPDRVCETVLKGDTHPSVLGYLAHVFKDEAGRSEMLALNAATDDRTFAFLASLPHRRVVEIASNNQQRLLRHQEIVDALGNNPLTGRATIDRILSFLGMQRPAAETPEEPDADLPPAEDLTDDAAAAALRALLGDDASDFAEELIRDHDGAMDPELEGNLFALVQTMNVMQKIKLARMGNKEARNLLVRDRNKIVASAAMRSPKITENEVEGFARARNVSDEVLRIIAANREWTRSYQVKLGLATNPKCPVPTAMRFLNFLQERDLKNIMKSKDVSGPVATHARRMLQKKGKDLMAEFDSQGADVNARILYWGVEGAGKNTNLETIYAKLRPDHRGELEQVPTRLDPTVSYSVMPIELGQIGGLRTRIQVSTVPGGPEHAPTRKQLLDQVDGIVFVVDTTRERLDENLASFEELRAALLDYGRPLEQVPLVVQYNKRHESDPYALEELHRKLQMPGVAAFEAVASDGTAVLQTLTTISKRVIRHLRERAEQPAAPAPVAPPVVETPAPAPPAPFEIAPPPVPAAEATLAPAILAEPEPLATSALEPELLGTAAEEDALLTAEAEAFFEPGFQQATAPEPAPSVAIADAGPATRTADGRVRLPVVLRDASGNEHTVTLSVAIEPPEPGSH